MIAALAATAFLAYQIPSLQARVNWKIDEALTYMRGVINPVKPIPTAAAYDPNLTSAANPAFSEKASLTPTSTRTPRAPHRHPGPFAHPHPHTHPDPRPGHAACAPI
jgi:hypothetical protein